MDKLQKEKTEIERNYHQLESAVDNYKKRLLINEKETNSLKVANFEKEIQIQSKSNAIDSKDAELNELNIELMDLYDKWNSRLQPAMKKDIFAGMTNNIKKFYRSSTTAFRGKINKEALLNKKAFTKPIIIQAEDSKIIITIINIIKNR